MNTKLLLIPLFLLAATTFAADRPAVPADPIAKTKELLLSDDFNRADLGNKWKEVVPTFTLENNTLKGTQTRVNKPAADGKPAVVGHQAVIGSDVPTKDSVIELRFRLASASAVSVEFDDRKFTGSHYGHICFARITPKSIVLADQKEGSMRNDIYEMSKDPSKKEERAKLLKGTSISYPLQIDADQWHTLVLETVGDEMRATIDDKPVAFFKSPGIKHPTKSKIELGCAGQSGYFDDIKIFNAEPAR